MHVGVWASVATGLLPTGLRMLAQRSPEIVVRSVELAPEAGSEAVRDGSLDLSFVIDYSNYSMPRTPALERQVIAVEHMYVAVRAGTLGPEPVALESLAPDPWILADSRSHFGRAVRIACRRAGYEPDVRHVVGEQSTALSMVAAGLGVTLVSDLVAAAHPPGVQLIPLTGPFERHLSLTFRARDAGRQSVRRFVDTMADAAFEVGLAPPHAVEADSR